MIEWDGLADLGCGDPHSRWIFRTEVAPGGMWARWTALARAPHSIRVKQLGDPASQAPPRRWGSDQRPPIIPPGVTTWDIGKEMSLHHLWKLLPRYQPVLTAVEEEFGKWGANGWNRF